MVYYRNLAGKCISLIMSDESKQLTVNSTWNESAACSSFLVKTDLHSVDTCLIFLSRQDTTSDCIEVCGYC